MSNLSYLVKKLKSSGIIADVSSVDGTASNAKIHFADGFTPTSEQQTTIDTIQATADMDAQSESDQLVSVQSGAKSQAENIPNWAGWSEDQSVDYITANVTDLDSARVVLIAMAKMIVALRNQQWPDLQN